MNLAASSGSIEAIKITVFRGGTCHSHLSGARTVWASPGSDKIALSKETMHGAHWGCIPSVMMSLLYGVIMLGTVHSLQELPQIPLLGRIGELATLHL